MPKLKHTKVMRGGQTASPSGWKEVQNLKKDFDVRMYETTKWNNLKQRHDKLPEKNWKREEAYLTFTIEINAAGGGITEIYIKIGIKEFPAIFQLIAKEIPDTAPIFSKCTTMAINSNIKMRQELSELDEL